MPWRVKANNTRQFDLLLNTMLAYSYALKAATNRQLNSFVNTKLDFPDALKANRQWVVLSNKLDSKLDTTGNMW